MDLKSEVNAQKQAIENLTKSINRLAEKKENPTSQEKELPEPKNRRWILQAFGLLLLFGSWLTENMIGNSYQDKLNTINSIRFGTLNLDLKESIDNTVISKFVGNPPTNRNDSMSFKNSLLEFNSASLSIQSNANEMFYIADRRSKADYLAERRQIGIKKRELGSMNDVQQILLLYNFYALRQSEYRDQQEKDIQELSDLTQDIYKEIDFYNNLFFWFYLTGSLILALYYTRDKVIFVNKKGKNKR
jgi:hypothetical protein